MFFNEITELALIDRRTDISSVNVINFSFIALFFMSFNIPEEASVAKMEELTFFLMTVEM
jgi:hypothetical protein